MLTPTYGANKPAMPQSAQKSSVIVNLDDRTIFFLGYVTPIEGVDIAHFVRGRSPMACRARGLDCATSAPTSSRAYRRPKLWGAAAGER
jgi:hypothetical protein